MKKLSFLMLGFVFFCAGLNAATVDLRGSHDLKYYEWSNQAITDGSSISVSFANIIDFDSLDFNMVASSGSIPTGNVSWLSTSGFELASATLTSGTPITQMEAPIITLTFTNHTGGDITVTGNAFAVRKGK